MFAATAAYGTLLGLLSQAALCLAYSWSARRAAWWTSTAVGVSAFLVTTLLVERVSLALPVAFALVCGGLLLTAGVMPVPALAFGPVRPPRWDLAMRMLVATTIVVGLTTIAATGPRRTGLLSPFPVFALVLGAFTHRTKGPVPRPTCCVAWCSAPGPRDHVRAGGELAHALWPGLDVGGRPQCHRREWSRAAGHEPSRAPARPVGI